MAACWKLSWNEDPLPLSVPLSLAEPPPPAAAVPPDEPPLGAEVPDEEHAPRVSVNATTATPAAVACFLYRSCIFSTHLFPAAMSAASDGRSACKAWCA